MPGCKLNSRVSVAIILTVLCIKTLSFAATYQPIGTGDSFIYNNIPFKMGGICVEKSLSSFRPIDSTGLTGFMANKIHIVQSASWSDDVTDGVIVGQANVYYTDGSHDALDIIMGQNISEWAFDRPEFQHCVQHSRATIAYSYWTNIESSYFYWGHWYYASIDTRNIPLDHIELVLDPRSYSGQQYYGCGLNTDFGICINALTLGFL